MNKAIRTYSELIRLPTFKERFQYLRLDGTIGTETFGFDRYMNQLFYNSRRWKEVRDHVIVRDSGFDLAVGGLTIYGKILIHHMNPITARDIQEMTDLLLDPEFLICTAHGTHNAIHYGSEVFLPQTPVERCKNDTCPWKYGKEK